MLISRKAARELLADLTDGCSLPLEVGELVRREFVHHGHVLLGDVALRGYKHKGQWHFDERDVRAAGRALAAVVVDRRDLVEIRFPARRALNELVSEEERARADWRREISDWIHNAALHKWLQQERVVGEVCEREARVKIGANGLPGALTLEEFTAAYGSGLIGGTRPVGLLVWSGTCWCLPRGYADLLDRWEVVHEELVAKARICSGCRREGPRYRDWRTPTTAGYITLCPACSGASFRRYDGRLYGVAYGMVPRGLRADDYLCRLCTASRASVWDHCHEHGYVRGPLCASCNGHEGHTARFLSREGAAEYLLQCRGCREQRTLPPRFQTDIVRRHLEQTERHGRCRTRPRARELEATQDRRRYVLYCPNARHIARWTKEVTAVDAAGLVASFVADVLRDADS